MFTARTHWFNDRNPLAAALDRRRADGLPVLDLCESNPTQAGFVYDPAAILSPLAAPGSLRYEPNPRGLILAREAVAAYYAGVGVAIDPSRIVLTSGTSEAYSFALRLLADPNDEILCPAPSYPLLEFLGGLNDVSLIHYALTYDHGWRIDFEDLRSRITSRTRALVIVHPNNPTGSYLRSSELPRVAALAQKHGLALIVDEVFRDYQWKGRSGPEDDPPAGSTVAVENCLTLTLNGLSKLSGLPQMKLAWMVVSGPRDLASGALDRLEVIADTYLSVGTPIQHAAAALIEAGKEVRKQILERVETNLHFLDAALAAGGPVSRLRASGGWYASLRLPGTLSDEGWALEFLERDGVYTHPGHFFGFGGGPNLVLSLIPEPAVFEDGITKVLRRVASRA